jgi:hypothetical protein
MQVETNRAGLRKWLGRLVDASLDLLLGLTCLAGLQAPALLPGELLAHLPRLVMIEFAAIHCTGFMFLVWLMKWDLARRAAYLAALTAAYTLVLGVIAIFLGDAWPLGIFWGLIGNRSVMMLVGNLPDERRQEALTHAWAGTTTLYVVAMSAGMLFAGKIPAQGLLLAGFLYYTSVALSELGGWGWVFRWMQRARERNR